MTGTVDTSKIVGYEVVGPEADTAVVSKLVMYVIYMPGSPTGTPAPKQAHVYSQIIRNS